MPLFARSRFEKIRLFIKKSINLFLTPFRWVSRKLNPKTKHRRSAHRTSHLNNKLNIKPPLDYSSLENRFLNDKQRVQTLQKYQCSASVFFDNLKALMDQFASIEAAYTKKQLLANDLTSLECSLAQVERSLKETLEYQKIHLTILLFQKIKAWEALVNRLPESDGKKEIIKDLRDMLEAIKRENEYISQLSSPDQEVVYTTKDKERLIQKILDSLEKLPIRISHEQSPIDQGIQKEHFNQDRYSLEVLINLANNLKTIPILPLHLRTSEKVTEINIERLKRACAHYQEKCDSAHARLAQASSKEEMDKAAHALALLYTQAEDFYRSKFWDEAIAQKRPAAANSGELHRGKP